MNLNKANPTSFELIFPKLPIETNMSEHEEFLLNIFGTLIPGINIDPTEMRWLGAKTLMDSGNITFDMLNTNFIVDSEFKNWKILFQWIMYIHNNKNIFGKNPADYSVDVTLKMVDNFQSPIMNIKFINVWPSSLGEVSLNTREGDTQLECMISFNYDRYEV